jgi:hypothetical protein
MAKKEQKIEEPIALDVQLNKSGAFIEKNWKKIAVILGAIIVAVTGFYIYKNLMADKEIEAQKAIASLVSSIASLGETVSLVIK